MSDKLFPAYINPLAFLAVDSPWADMDREEVTRDQIIDYICPTGNTDIGALVEKYKQISVEEVRLNAVPAEDRILEKLIWPLRHAKASFMLGNYLGTISLCGMVAEMVSILFYDISEIQFNGELVSEEKQREIFGATFEKLSQDRRVRALKGLGIINDEVKSKFDTIRLIRRRYLHLWSQDHERVATDAVEAFKQAESLVVDIIGQDLKDGKFVLNPAILKYLEKGGFFEPEE